MNENSEYDLKKYIADLEARKVLILEKDHDLKAREAERSKLSNPLIIAIIAASLAGLSNAAVAFLNGSAQRELENNKAASDLRLEERRLESARILEAIKTDGDTKRAVTNVKFLIDIGLIKTDDVIKRTTAYFVKISPGEGPSLPGSTSNVGRFVVQVGVRNSFEDGEAAVREFKEKYPELLKDQPALLEQLFVNNVSTIRVRFGPYDKSRASTLCSDLQSIGGSCFVALGGSANLVSNSTPVSNSVTASILERLFSGNIDAPIGSVEPPRDSVMVPLPPTRPETR